MKKHVCLKEIVWTEKQIISIIKEKTQNINKYYQGKDKPVVIGVLKGCVLFMSHLINSLNFDIDIDFLTVQRTKGSTILDSFNLIWGVDVNVKGRSVLIVEDVIDTGVTLSELKKYFIKKEVKEFKSVTLIDKPKNRKVNFEADWKFIELDTKEWLVGWGFDLDEKYRNLPYIGFLKDELKG